jgi:hypothetical protein
VDRFARLRRRQYRQAADDAGPLRRRRKCALEIEQQDVDGYFPLNLEMSVTCFWSSRDKLSNHAFKSALRAVSPVVLVCRVVVSVMTTLRNLPHIQYPQGAVILSLDFRQYGMATIRRREIEGRHIPYALDSVRGAKRLAPVR